MAITILTVGKKKKDIFNELFEEYVKRIKRMSKLKVKYLKDYGKLKENKKIIVKKESEIILQSFNKNSYHILMDIRGKKISSTTFAKILEKNDITFIIGGMFGVNNDVKKSVEIIMSFSDMTLPHKLARIFLAEQIYRGIMINKGMRYHK